VVVQRVHLHNLVEVVHDDARMPSSMVDVHAVWPCCPGSRASVRAGPRRADEREERVARTAMRSAVAYCVVATWVRFHFLTHAEQRARAGSTLMRLRAASTAHR
jgi:hypothetical protein